MRDDNNAKKWKLRVLENKGSIAFLFSIPDRELIVTEIRALMYQYGVGVSALYTLLKELIDAGLIEEERKYRVRLIRLTDKGRELKRRLLDIEEWLEKDP